MGGGGRNADFTKDKTSIHDMTFTDATKQKLRHKYNDYRRFRRTVSQDSVTVTVLRDDSMSSACVLNC